MFMLDQNRQSPDFEVDVYFFITQGRKLIDMMGCGYAENTPTPKIREEGVYRKIIPYSM